MAVCTDHPDEPALYACPACLRLLCTACFTSDPRGAKRCRHCESEVQRVAARSGAITPPPVAAPASAAPLPQARVLAAPPPPISSRLGSVFAFGVRKDMLLMFGGLAFVTSALRYFGHDIPGMGSLLLVLIAAGLEAAFYFQIVEQRAAGDDAFQMPEFSGLSEITRPFWRYLMILVPIFAAIIWYGIVAIDDAMAGPAEFFANPPTIFHYGSPALLLVVGVLGWPLMTIIAAIWRSWIMAYHPGIWIKTLKMLGADYAVGAVVFYAILLGETFVLTPILRALPLPTFLALLVGTFVGYIPMGIRARLLGEISEPYFRL